MPAFKAAAIVSGVAHTHPSDRVAPMSLAFALGVARAYASRSWRLMLEHLAVPEPVANPHVARPRDRAHTRGPDRSPMVGGGSLVGWSRSLPP